MTKRTPFASLRDVESILLLKDKISLFGGLSEQQLRTIFQLLKSVRYRAGETIFREGDQSSYIYIIVSGKVRPVFNTKNHPLSKTEFKPGACFGETAVIGIQPHSASTIAMQETELMVMSNEALMSIFESDQKLFSLLILNIAREASRRLYRTDKLLAQYAQGVETRVAS